MTAQRKRPLNVTYTVILNFTVQRNDIVVAVCCVTLQ